MNRTEKTKVDVIEPAALRDIADLKKNQIDDITRISVLMQFQARMPICSFMTKDEAYKRAGCDPRAAMFIFAR